jgi:hypothetical protein
LLGIDVPPGLPVVLLAAEEDGDTFEIVPLGAGQEILYADITIVEEAVELGRFHG